MTAPEPEEPDDEPVGFVDPRPRNVEAEQAVLGAMMLNPDSIGDVLHTLRADDFYRPSHATIFTTIVSLFEDGAPVDAVVVAEALTRAGALQQVGGAPYLHTLIADVPVAANAGYYADIVAEYATRGRLIETAQYLHQLAASGQTEGVAERAREAVDRATASREAGDAGAWVGDVIDDEVASWDEPPPEGLGWPFRDVDDLTNGMKPGQLILVAGRPGVGKSTVAMDVARHAAKHGASTLFASLEMSRSELIMRLTCAESRVRLSDVKGRTVSPHDRLRIKTAQETLAGMPLRIEDDGDMTLGQLRALARETARGSRGLDLLVLDYIQLLTPADARVIRQEQVAAFSRGLKRLAKELAVPVIEVAQLNRGPEQRSDKVPQMSDLRESGALEQDADMVVLLHRPDAVQRDDPRAGETDLIVAKHRGGATATVTVAHQLHYCRFVDIAREEQR